MSKLIQVNVVEIRRKKKLLLELTEEEVVDLHDLLESQKTTHHGGWSSHAVTSLRPRLASLLHNLQNGPSEIREEEIDRASRFDQDVDGPVRSRQ